MSTETRPIGCIADDITGATDLASALAGRGLDARVCFTSAAVPDDGGDALVVALKVRSVPAPDARAAVTEAAHALRAAGVEQIFSKYCSTFDSTADGNIGPIADALADACRARRVVHCPSYPANGRTVYLGHLFVGNQLLSESSMRDHPLNPMRDSDLQRLLSAQTPRAVALVTLPTVEAGVAAVSTRLRQISSSGGGVHHVIADAVRDADLDTLAEATAGAPLAAGGAAYGAAFAASAHRRAGGTQWLEERPTPPRGPTAILAGSLSRATREQVRAFDGPTLTLAVDQVVDGEVAVGRAVAFATRSLANGPVLITTDHDAAVTSNAPLGLASAEVSRTIELIMGRIALELGRLGVRRFVVAGGETSGAVADALGLRSARVGPDISVGVPWMVAEDRPLAVAFKSGNFGGPSFFGQALEVADQ